MLDGAVPASRGCIDVPFSCISATRRWRWRAGMQAGGSGKRQGRTDAARASRVGMLEGYEAESEGTRGGREGDVGRARDVQTVRKGRCWMAGSDATLPRLMRRSSAPQGNTNQRDALLIHAQASRTSPAAGGSRTLPRYRQPHLKQPRRGVCQPIAPPPPHSSLGQPSTTCIPPPPPLLLPESLHPLLPPARCFPFPFLSLLS